MLNAYWEPLRFAIPTAAAVTSPWFRIIDTSLASPNDILEGDSERVAEPEYLLAPRSIVLIVNRNI
jgi:glycogen operon protein